MGCGVKITFSGSLIFFFARIFKPSASITTGILLTSDRVSLNIFSASSVVESPHPINNTVDVFIISDIFSTGASTISGDNAAAAVGTGTVGDGQCNISLGTSGTIFISSKDFGVDENNALHSFDHADGSYHLMGCMLSAASCNKWWSEEILQTKDFVAEQAPIQKLGENQVFFLPYLMGERSPHNNPDARGVFFGMSMDTTRADMTQAVLEGVAFGLRDSLEVARSLGISIERTKICGGGAKSPLWKKIIANVMNLKVDVPENEEGPSMGGAMLAAVGCGAYPDVETICKKMVKVVDTVEPDPELVAKYEEKYQKFRKLYPTMKELF